MVGRARGRVAMVFAAGVTRREVCARRFRFSLPVKPLPSIRRPFEMRDALSRRVNRRSLISLADASFALAPFSGPINGPMKSTWFSNRTQECFFSDAASRIDGNAARLVFRHAHDHASRALVSVK